ncbi:Pyrimidine nucleoside phosphorylase C-terminal domain-containing protein [Mesorhizobium albiziae]|uniref:Pyrimidine nucleoside phosphorylase C-terminal domain-containing protein n=1 Tax=Neomesorhizobium albiziae TaxID=335020 RepID=A0A1I4EJX4_9HYPH|nr:hypothetical protein [Mesorhizobium albiziae]GLS32014.1 hypothetical protein GCM10007937_37240 [Mesorhizobium albiziae]SFL04756.1 Pyrimidine nucleoside phosphorylase C-terminal domain-containing protein [Mesorhizobium albiziae]
MASAAGNAVEVENAVEFLTGRFRDERLEEVTLALAAELLQAAGTAGSNREGWIAPSGRCRAARLRKFSGAWWPDSADRRILPRNAGIICPRSRSNAVSAPKYGYVAGVATQEIGLAVVTLGRGRIRPEDSVNYSVRITHLLPVGAEVKAGDGLALVHARSEADAEEAVAAIQSAYTIGETKPATAKVIVRRIAPRG